MSDVIFFRLLSEDVHDKPAVLEEKLAAINAGEDIEEVFTVANQTLGQIPGSPFAYWVSDNLRNLFQLFPRAETDNRMVRVGDHPGDQDRYIRNFWEAPYKRRNSNRGWLPYQKGGIYSPFYADIYLIADWDHERETFFDFHGRKGRSSEHPSNYQYFFRPGLTWPRRTNGFSVRILPVDCIFADKGPAVFIGDNDHENLLALVAIMNSIIFEYLVRLQLARTELAQSYEVGLIQNTPIPSESDERLAPLARRAHDLQREKSLSDEASHVFQLPALVAVGGESLAAASAVLAAQAQARQIEFDQAQTQIDEIVFDLYGLEESDRELVRREMGSPTENNSLTDEAAQGAEEEPDEDEEVALSNDLPSQVQNLLMWCVGVAFGRWDVRKALDPSLLPPLPEPFDPLPRCAPGALMNAERLPVEQGDLSADYPLPIAWDGVLIDDPAQESNPQSRDIVARVRAVLTLLWGDRADNIEREICVALGVQDLRDYFRNPSKGFFNFHIKRYSKSRRKAPIYWLLQSERRNCAVWLYYPRLVENTPYIAENIVYDLMQREQFRLDEYKTGLESFSGAERKRREREIDLQTRLLEEIRAFHKGVLKLANLKLPPDHNDGVLISIAPLHELVPWKEAEAMWQKLLRGDYPWSGMSEQMRQRGVLKS